MAGCQGCGGALSGRQRKWCSDGCRKREARRAHIWQCFRITLEEYDTILAEQGGGCGICGNPPTPQKALAVDHDHRTGYVRGLLCFFCNRRVLGARNADTILRMADYVSSPPARRALGRDVVAPGRPKKKRRRSRKTAQQRKRNQR